MKKIIWSGFLVASALSTAYITPILADEVNNITKNEVENIDTETQEKNCNMSDESTVDGKTQYVEKADNSGYEDDSNSSIPSTDQLTEGWQSDGRYFENGTYLINQFKEIDGSTYYFDQDGYRVANQLLYIDSAPYYFDETGVMQTGWQNVNGNKMYFGSDGAALTNTWKDGKYLDYDGIVVDNGQAGDYYLIDGEIQKDQLIGYRYYGSDGKYLKNQWKTIDNKLMFFSETGDYCSNGIYYANDNYYAFDEMGYMISTPGLYEFYGSKYYIQDNGVILTYAWKDDSYFSGSGSAITNQTWYVGDKCYIFDSESKLIKLSGWYTLNGNQYYLNGDGTVLTKAWKDDHYLGYYGNVVTNGEAGDYYLIDGKIQKDQFINSRYYGSDGKCLKNQWKKIDDKWMFFSESGDYCRNGVYYANDNYYLFDKMGYMISTPGLYEFYGSKYYIQDNGVILTYAWKDDSYFSGTGAAITNQTWHVGDKCYIFDSESKLIKISGWYILNGNQYYLNGDGTVLTKAWKDDHYLGDYGDVVTNGKAGDYYLIDGKIQKDQFINSRYYGSDGKYLKNQWKYIDGHWMYFSYSGEYWKEGVYNINDKYYAFDNDGYMISIAGWYDFYGTKYYVQENGEVLTNSWKDDSYLTGSGSAIKDQTWYIGEKLYAFDSDAKLMRLSGWQVINGEKYYLNGDGTVLTKAWKDNYYLDYYGRVVTNGQAGDYYLIDGEIQKNQLIGYRYYGSDGKYLKNQWKYIDGHWMYFSGSGYYESGYKDNNGNVYIYVYSINNKYYGFDENGYMVTGLQKSSGELYYFTSNGSALTNAWKDGRYFN